MIGTYRRYLIKKFIRNEPLSSLQMFKTLEQTINLEQEDQWIRLLDSRSIKRHKKDYNFIHFGMIQVVAKPLTRIGLKISIVMC